MEAQRNHTDESMGQLRRFADQLSLQAHLAGRDAKGTWARIEPRLREYERRAKVGTSKVADNLLGLGTEL